MLILVILDLVLGICALIVVLLILFITDRFPRLISALLFILTDALEIMSLVGSM